MQEWSAGYVADIGYTYGYYPELNPLRARLALLHRGILPPQVSHACELGFGQGVSVNLHAAAGTVEWHGTDFNPAQAGFARSLSEASGVNAVLADDAFADFAARSDLPDFDFICLHGIWSWVSDANRATIVDFIRRKLRPGGLVYVTYNTLPGWAPFMPMRHLLTRHAEVFGSEGEGISQRIKDSVAFVESLIATQPLYTRINSAAAARIGKMEGQSLNYLAHEYFNRDWQPMHFADMATHLAAAKLQFAASGNYLDHVDPLNLSSEQQEFLRGIPDPLFRESVFDYMINQQFRRDYWIKGVRRLAPLEQAERLRAERVILVSDPNCIELKVRTPRGDASLQEAVYRPLLALLADYQPRSLGEIEQALASRDLIFPQLLQAVMVLAGSAHLMAAQDAGAIEKAKPHTERLNQYLCQQARWNFDVDYLASPVTGGGYYVGRSQQLFLLARAEGLVDPADWARYAWRLISAQAQKLVKDGRTLETPEENLQELHAQAQILAKSQLPILKALQIV